MVVRGRHGRVGLRPATLGNAARRPTARYSPSQPDGRRGTGSPGWPLAFLLLRAFSSGCAALTGVEAICNGVPAFRKPKSKNAATTLLLMGVIAVTMFCGIIALAPDDSEMAENPATQLIGADGQPVGDGYHQHPVIAQVADAVFGDVPTRRSTCVAAATALILFLAANTAFNGFPVLGSILAQDRYLPRQLHTRGDRLAFSNGIILLARRRDRADRRFDAEVTRLIQLYIVGVFVSFTLSQTGMVRHWNRLLRDRDRPGRAPPDAPVPGDQRLRRWLHRRWCWSSCWSPSSPTAPGSRSSPWPILFLMMNGIRRHYDDVAGELASRRRDRLVLPVPRPRDRARLQAAQADAAGAGLRPRHPADTLEAVTVDVDPEDDGTLQAEWDRRGIPVPLKVLDSPVPGDHPADHRLRRELRRAVAARRGDGLHPRVRRRPLVGAPAAQPERAAAQGPAAVHARA